MDSDFETKLQQQSLRQVPADWRDDILRRARSASSQKTSPSVPLALLPLAITRKLWMELFWPARRIWVGLAAAWAIILILNLNGASRSELASHDFTPLSPAVLTAWREQDWLALGFAEPVRQPDADRPKNVAPQPRSERPSVCAAV